MARRHLPVMGFSVARTNLTSKRCGRVELDPERPLHAVAVVDEAVGSWLALIAADLYLRAWRARGGEASLRVVGARAEQLERYGVDASVLPAPAGAVEVLADQMLEREAAYVVDQAFYCPAPLALNFHPPKIRDGRREPSDIHLGTLRPEGFAPSPVFGPTAAALQATEAAGLRVGLGEGPLENLIRARMGLPEPAWIEPYGFVSRKMAKWAAPKLDDHAPLLWPLWLLGANEPLSEPSAAQVAVRRLRRTVAAIEEPWGEQITSEAERLRHSLRRHPWGAEPLAALNRLLKSVNRGTGDSAAPAALLHLLAQLGLVV